MINMPRNYTIKNLLYTHICKLKLDFLIESNNKKNQLCMILHDFISSLEYLDGLTLNDVIKLLKRLLRLKLVNQSH